MATILVVDDRPSNREYLVTLLGYGPHRLFEASDGAEALLAVGALRPDLVITDILMPTMDGYEFVRRLRSDSVLAKTMVVFFTAHYRRNEAEALAQSCGVEHILTKPCEPAEIIRVVDLCLGGSEPSVTTPSDEFDREHLRILTDKLSHTVNDLRASGDRLAALLDINLLLASERDPKELLRRVCASARELIGCRYAAVAVEGKGEGKPLYMATSGMDATMAEGLGPPSLDKGIVGEATSRRAPVRASRLAGGQEHMGLPSAFPLVTSLLASPIMSVERTYGWLCLTEKMGAAEFSTEDERLLLTLTSQAGRIYENGSLYADVQRQAAVLIAEVERRRGAQAALAESEQRFRQMAEHIQDVFFLRNADASQILYISPAYEKIWGRSCGSLYGNPSSWTDSVHPDDRAHAQEEHRKGSLSGRFDYQYRIVRPDTMIRCIAVRGFPVRDDKGDTIRVAGIARDVTAQVEADTKIKRLNRVHAVLSGINTLIVRVRNPDVLFAEACRIAVEAGGFQLAWIGLLNPDASRMTLAGLAGKDAELQAVVAGLFPKPEGAAVEDSTVSLALKARAPFVSNDSQNDSRVKVGKLHAEFGIRSMAILPLIVGGATIGALVLGAIETQFFHADEMKLLNELAEDISFATDHIGKRERLEYLAHRDVLTGLANRTLFLERLSQRMASATKGGHKLAVGLVDLQRFKNINDTLGRAAGDDLLKQAARWLVENMGDESILARVGADQFGIMVPEVRKDGDVAHLVERKRRECLNHTFRVAGEAFHIAFTSGIALFPDDGLDADTLYKHAEAALKKAKAKGEHFLAYDPRMTETVAGAVTLENHLRQALERNEFVLHYQPKVSLATGKLTSAEALIRWNNPRTGLVPPGQFIPILEETGLIEEVGLWGLRQAIHDHLAWRNAGLPSVRIAVNVSPRQLRGADFVRQIRDAIALNPIAAGGLELELTESLIMEDVKLSIAKLKEIRALGPTIAVDDFGTGFSSLSYLSKLPIDTLKIDRSFVVEMTNGPEGLSLVSTIIGLAHSLRLKVVAEGVETEEQSRLLRLLNCDEMQGFLFSKGVPADEFATRFLSNPKAAITPGSN